MRYLLPTLLTALSAGTTHAVSLISLDFSGSMTPIQQQTFIDAAGYWNSVITGYDLTSDGDGLPTPHQLVITASVPFIDGVGGVLGSAGPDDYAYYDNDPLTPNPTIALHYATTGVMEFDSADVAALIANNTFYGVVLHEMAHVLGIGTLWTLNNNVNGTTYQLYNDGSGQYTGPNALARWRSEFNQPSATFVPVELGGGGGTANGHWNENDGGGGSTGFVSNISTMDFTNELMTGWASGSFFVSGVTLGGIDDLGYIVDYSKAGVVNHVVVPEVSTFLLCALGPALLIRRRR
ncbi:MAG: leishmanolysin-related zinc metalloendopeptidase [Verrucomicrobiota bacterium]